jgi:ABC-2 type transport system permease protein
MAIPASELENPNDFVDMYIVQNQLINSIGRAYPPAIMASKALSGSGVISFLWFLGYLGINMGLFVLLIFFGNKFYYSAYSEIQESYASRKELSHEELGKKIILSKSKISALVTREWRYFLRVPSFSFNGLASVFIFPILIIIFSFSLNSSPDFAQIKTFIDKYSYFHIPVAIIISVLSSSLNSIASSVISREGKLVNELKSLPVSYRDIFISKFIHVSEITFMGIFFSALVLSFLLKLNIFEIIMIIIIGFINSSFLNALQMLVDVSRPKLTWDNPQKAMKQNLNVAISIPIVFGYSFILGFLGFILMNSVNQWIISILFMVLGAAGFYFIYRILIVAFKKFADKDISFIS